MDIRLNDLNKTIVNCKKCPRLVKFIRKVSSIKRKQNRDEVYWGKPVPGFGDLSSKIDPYLRPLYDALHDMLGAERVNRLVERDIIEIAPLAYMRGRTLREAFIIMDEGQNTTIEQMKMFLTRLGFGSKAVVNGDLSQIDLPKNITSGLRNSIEVLKDIDSIKFTHFGARDVIRHSLVQEIVQAYDNFE